VSKRSKTLKRRTRWTLLLVGNHGKTVRVAGFKAVTTAFIVILIAALGAAGVYYWLHRQAVGERDLLAQRMQRLAADVSRLTSEKEVLTARLIRTQSAEREAAAGAGETAAEEIREENITVTDGDAAAASNPLQTPAEEPAPVPDPIAAEPTSDVAVEDPKIVYDAQHDALAVNFIIRKEADDSETVEGRAFIVLAQSEAVGEGEYIVRPEAEIVSGIPQPYRRGQYFAISRFKAMTFHISGGDLLETFTHLHVFVYNDSQQLVAKAVFPLSETLQDG
jgi:hypothetical protein